MGTTVDDPVLTQFRAALDELYGDALERVVLYGSRARGDWRTDSDYDVAVFIRGLSDRWREMDRLALLGLDILDREGKFIHEMPYGAGAYRDRTPLMHEIRNDGLDL